MSRTPTLIPSWRQRLSALPTWKALLGLVLGSWLLRSLLTLLHPAPWILYDEFVYAELARSFAEVQEFRIRGELAHGEGILYPLLLSPVYWLFESLTTSYYLARIWQSLVMSLAALPAFFLARVIVSTRAALFVAALSVFIPSMVYTSSIMTENASYPLFLLVTTLLVRALARPTLVRQALLLVSIGLAYLARQQAVIFLPALLAAIGLFCLLGARSKTQDGFIKRFFAWTPTWIGGALGSLGALLHFGSVQATADVLLGRYKHSLEAENLAQYDLTGILNWILAHVGELALYVGVLPFAAFLVLLVRAIRRKHSSIELQAFAAGTLVVSAAFIVTVSAYAHSLELESLKERNLFFFVPALLAAFVWWLGQEGPRARKTEFAAAALSALVLLFIPFHDELKGASRADCLALAPWVKVAELVGSATIPYLFLAGGAVGALLFVSSRRRFATRMVLTYMLLLNVIVNANTAIASFSSYEFGMGGRRSWIDNSTEPGESVTLLFTRIPTPTRVYLMEFFNRRVGPVYHFGAEPDRFSGPQVLLDATTGEMLVDGKPLNADYIVCDSSIGIEGDLVKFKGSPALRLFRPRGPTLVRFMIRGVGVDGWTTGDLNYIQPGCTKSEVVFTFQGHQDFKESRWIRAYQGDEEIASFELEPSSDLREFRVPLQGEGNQCRIRINIEPKFIPREFFGTGDLRTLGLRLGRVVHPVSE